MCGAWEGSPERGAGPKGLRGYVVGDLGRSGRENILLPPTRAAVLPLRREAWERGGRNLSAPSGHLPLQGRLLALVWLHCVHAAQQCFQCEWLLLLTPNPSDKAFRRLYTVSRRNAMERNRRRTRLCPPGKAPIQAMAGGTHGVRGPALATWKIWLAPGRLCPSAKWVVRPQTDEILSSNRFQRDGVPPIAYPKARHFSLYIS